MNNKRIRLTESQLHRVIKESVRNILTELDWKTYANAAKKRAIKDGKGLHTNEKVRDLDAAASKALNQKYPSKDPMLYRGQIDTIYDDFWGHRQVGEYPYNYGDFRDSFSTDIDDPTKYYDGGSFNGERTKDMRDYFSGKSKYVKGKGWQ